MGNVKVIVVEKQNFLQQVFAVAAVVIYGYFCYYFIPRLSAVGTSGEIASLVLSLIIGVYVLLLTSKLLR